jgi:ATP-binding cassette, subfamily G (WHITE), member 2, SNQ2
VYFGPIGKDSEHLVRYFAENGAQCPPSVNPAEYMLDAIGAGSQRRVGDRDWADIYLDSKLFQENKQTIHELKQQALQEFPEEETTSTEYATPFLYQLKVVGKRTFLSFWRMPDYGFTRLFSHAIIALFTGLTFLQLGNSASDLQYRVFVIFIATVMPALILAQVEPTYIMARTIFIREDSSKMYSPWVFSLGQLVAEIPNSVLCAVVFFLLLTYPAGFQTDSSRAGYQVR